MKDKNKARLIALYLPQYHPIPENDEWWGQGFTEWTNVARARPLFKGHHQPNIPADLGYYDLRVPEVRESQAELARKHGIEGFCYWHYWFAGKRLLERPFNEMLRERKPDFPFCLAWANETWSGIWHGAPEQVLIEQTYPGEIDHTNHFCALLDAFQDPRYIRIDNKPVFLIYKLKKLPDPKRFTDLWRELALQAGLPGLYFVGMTEDLSKPSDFGVDAIMPNFLAMAFNELDLFRPAFLDRYCKKITGYSIRKLYCKLFSRPQLHYYKDVIRKMDCPLAEDFMQIPVVVPNWDNTPRCHLRGMVIPDSSPELFRKHLRNSIKKIANREFDKRVIFIKSWNEWAEGNYLEPDQKYGRSYLEVIKQELMAS